MSVKGAIFGVKALEDKLARLEPDARKELEDTVAEGTLLIHGEAIKSIQARLSSGAKYGNHTASKPGMPPNTDTGILVKSIEFDIDKQNLVGLVGSNLDYAAYLEFGTSNMEARPWLSRAFKTVVPDIVKSFERALKGLGK